MGSEMCIRDRLYPQEPQWNLENNWTGNDSYIFIHFDANVGTSSALWGSNTREQLLSTSPDNVHYFFISNRAQYESDILQMKEIYDEILDGFTQEQQDHWNKRLHFINEKTSNLNNWLSNVLDGKFAFAIDSFQKIREIGYLGNPANFSGTYIHYLAHEALYFDYERNTFAEPQQDYDEATIFEREYYTGGWAASISQPFDIPNDRQLRGKLILDCIKRIELDSIKDLKRLINLKLSKDVELTDKDEKELLNELKDLIDREKLLQS